MGCCLLKLSLHRRRKTQSKRQSQANGLSYNARVSRFPTEWKADSSRVLRLLLDTLSTRRSSIFVSVGMPSGSAASLRRWHATERSWPLQSHRDGQPVVDPDRTVPSIRIRMGCQQATK
ncbi:hypothetical protein EYF80_031547 [Liparis tanakae]|uniref:Uncharacterized protein n=1 Tax=Liparis tanakae TaxID=230148 RepID=A0A4Z2GYS0_9TELE|nr:hypothetical protein EYF80_031547 [Liparis tanakae]